MIALVITIIVLLILAGISISMLSGDNSILQKATTAKESTDSSQIQERINLAYHSSLMDGQGKVTETSLENELKKEFNKDTLDEGWLDKTSVEGKWKITIDNISLNIPTGESTTKKEITFYIGLPDYEQPKATYTAEEGMTFEAWIEKYSPANIAKRRSTRLEITYITYDGCDLQEVGGEMCTTDMVIKDGAFYQDLGD